MFAAKLKALSLSAVLALGTASAQATVIDFEGITSPDASTGFSAGSAIPSGAGYTVTVFGTGPYAAAYVYGGPATSTDTAASNGTAYVTIGDVGITVTSVTPFNVNSIDLTNAMYFPSGTTTAILTGTFADGRANIVASYMFNNDQTLTTNDFTTEMLTGFTNLTSFTVTRSGLGYSLALDNIDVSAAASAVPEPSTWAMLGLGLALIGGAARRKKSA